MFIKFVDKLFFFASKPTKARGFTLIELLVTVSIMVLLVGGGIASFISFQEKQQVLVATKTVQQFMQIALTKARVGEVPPGQNRVSDCYRDDSRLQAYRVTFDNPNKTITMTLLCGPDREDPSSYATTVPSYTLPSGFSFVDTPGTSTFYTLPGTIDGAGQVIITNGTYTYCFYVKQPAVISEVKEPSAPGECE